MMKKLIVALIILAAVPSLVLANNAAPYTEEALQEVVDAMNSVPKVEAAEGVAKEELFKQTMDYYSKVFDNAGYSLNDTINQIVDDMKNNPEAIPRDRQSVYNNLYILLTIMAYDCGSEKEKCLEFFPAETRESMQWFMENSEFSKQNSVFHHGIK